MEKPKIQIIQILRGYAALSVFVSHFFGDYSNHIHMTGQLGVAVFYWISGFLMVYTTSGKTKHYLINRLIRIVPLYYLTTFAVFVIGHAAPNLLHTSNPTIENLIKSLFFIPCRINKTGMILPLFPICWTLYLEIFVSVIFFIGLRIFNSNIKSGIMVAIILLVAVCINEFTGTNEILINTYGNLVALYWVVGILFAIFYGKNVSKPKENVKNKSFEVKKQLFIIFGGILFLIFERFYELTFVKIVLISVLLILLIQLCADTYFPKAYLFLGRVSYSFYLIHYFVVKFFSRLIVPQTKVEMVFSFLVSFSITLFLSYISYELVESRFASWLKGKERC